MSNNISQKVAKGVFWNGISIVSNQLIGFLVTIILARLLSPGDFGLLAMVAVFTNFFSIILDLGLGSAVIQKQKLDKIQLSSVFWISVIFGFILSLITISISPLIALFYKQKIIFPIMSVLGLNFLFASWGNIPSALLSKELRFKSLALISITSNLVSGAVAVLMAIGGFGVWALVMKNVIATIITSFLNFLVSKLKPLFVLEIKKIKELLYFGGNVLGFNFVNYFARNADNLLIGKFLGKDALGLYDLSYQILLFPLRRISWTIGSVMFPALSAVQEDKQKVASGYLRANRMIAFIVFPMMLGLFVVAPEFIKFVLGEKWLGGLFVLRIFCIVGMLQSVGTTIGWIYLSQGRADLMLKVSIVFVSIYICAFIIGLNWGINGVAFCYFIALLIILYPLFKIPFKLINLKIKKLISILLGSTISSLLMSIVVWQAKTYLLKWIGYNRIFLFYEIILGIVLYGVFTIFFNRSIFQEIKAFINYVRR